MICIDASIFYGTIDCDAKEAVRLIHHEAEPLIADFFLWKIQLDMCKQSFTLAKIRYFKGL